MLNILTMLSMLTLSRGAGTHNTIHVGRGPYERMGQRMGMTKGLFIAAASTGYEGMPVRWEIWVSAVSHRGASSHEPMIDVAMGLGMTERQILCRVRAPFALPTILAGVRIAGVWTIGMCTLTSLVGSGGLGDLILQGLRSMRAPLVLAGTIPAALLAVLFEVGMSALERWLMVRECTQG